ncbi:hypothetical protein SKAU_G00311370 [Synaphobranchus kaupii]|uniref:Uncharacterized protein n=1 Tax=Synaphobranchus kaupii TaxID=118154 RepID=A0A9Q1ERQ7_SYNKA|nr:hypothetical protein SKAU_G00311370 [Synaphobranchus kaupii]
MQAYALKHLQQHESAVEGEACCYHCSLCNYSTKAKLNLIQHVHSMKHQRGESLRKLQRLQKGLPEEEEELSAIFTIRKCPSADAALASVRRDYSYVKYAKAAIPSMAVRCDPCAPEDTAVASSCSSRSKPNPAEKRLSGKRKGAGDEGRARCHTVQNPPLLAWRSGKAEMNFPSN